jgi:hypothetical protein
MGCILLTMVAFILPGGFSVWIMNKMQRATLPESCCIYFACGPAKHVARLFVYANEAASLAVWLLLSQIDSHGC